MAAVPVSIRYRALQRYSYARALLALVALARVTAGSFSFGPVSLHALERNGLTVSGPDLQEVAAVLAAVPGLVEVPA